MASIQGMSGQDEDIWQRLLRGTSEGLRSIPSPVAQGLGMSMTPEGRAKYQRQGLLSAPWQSTYDLMGQGFGDAAGQLGDLGRTLFLGRPGEPVDNSSMVPNEGQMNMAASLGMASPSESQRPGSVEQALGFGPKYDESKWPAPPEYSFPGGQVAPLRQMESVAQTPYQSYEKARTELGTGPEPVEGPSRMEKLARVLGGAASGARRGLTPGAARSGSSTAAVLSGAGAGTGDVITQLSREEQVRQSQFRMRQDRFKAQSAQLETQIANSRSAVDRDRAMAKRWEVGQNFKAQLAHDQATAPKHFSLSDGRMVVVKTDPETGQVTNTMVDFGHNFRMAKLQTAQRIAQSKGKVWLGGSVEIDRSSVTPNVHMAILRAQEYLATGNGKATVYKWLEENKDIDMSEIETQVLSQMLDQGKFDMTLLFATIDMMEQATAEMLASQIAGDASGPLNISESSRPQMTDFYNSGR